MTYGKKILILLLFFLLFLSFVHDLKKDHNLHEHAYVKTEYSNNNDNHIAHVKVHPGDTVLSITEELNELDYLDIKKIIADFELLNPGTDPDILTPNTFYYFPLYNEQ